MQHTFTLGVRTLDNVDTYKYLGVHSSGNPKHYMAAARRNLDHSYARMRRQHCGMACGSNLQLQLRMFDALVTSGAMFGGELWGLRRGMLVEQNKTASRYVKHLKQLAGLPTSTHTESFLLELRRLSLPARWLQCGVRFWNQLLALPVDDLYRDVLFDSASNGFGFAHHLQRACRAVGYALDLGALQLRRLECSANMQLRQEQQEVAADVDPRTCPSRGAAFRAQRLDLPHCPRATCNHYKYKTI